MSMLRAEPEDPVRAFWAWFEQREQKLFKAPGHSEEFEELWTRLKAISKHLTYECGPESKAPRDLILSADGIKEGFAFVESLADAAPTLSNWRIIRFRPRIEDYALCELSMYGKCVKGDDIEFVLFSNGELMGIDLFVRGCEADDDLEFGAIAFILADGALGEYDMECKVGAFRVRAWDSTEHRDDRRPFADLRECFDDAFERHCTRG